MIGMYILQNRVKFIQILALLLVFVPIASSVDSIYTINGEFAVDEAHEFVFLNETQVENASLQISSPDGVKVNENMSVVNESFSAEIESDFFAEKGVYDFSYKIDEQNLPVEGNHSIYIGDGNQTKYTEFLDFANNRASESPFCAEEGEFTCEYEHFQASMMLKAAQAYFLTGNTTFKQEALNFSTKEYGSQEDRRLECRHTIGDFDCSADDSGSFNVSGAVRQGSLINSLWTVYSRTGNQTVRSLAQNYSEGSAEECNVWESNFDCGNGENQGHMASGYWKAYKVTGDLEFKQIAANLTLTNYTDTHVSAAGFRGYQLTGDETYLDIGKNSFREDLEDCQENCNSSQKLGLANAGLEGYKATSNHGFYIEALLNEPDKSEKCSEGQNGICEYPDQQASASLVSAGSYMAFGEEEKRFYNPLVVENPSNNESLVAKISISGLVDDSRAVLVDKDMNELDRCNIDVISNTCEFDHVWQDQQVYYLRFESETLSYPNRGIPVTYTQTRPDLLSTSDTLLNGTLSNSSCDPNNEDYSCVISDERSQTYYIDGLSKAYNYLKADKHLKTLNNLSSPPYHYNETEPYRAECLPDEGYDDGGNYSCTSFDGVFAGQKQGSLVSNLFESYSLSSNNPIRELATKYAETSVSDSEDCQVWNNDFECRSSESQGEMIQGYLTAYQVTGNHTYKDITKNLIDNAQDYSASYELASSMWHAYYLIGGQNESDIAENMTQNILSNQSCIEEQCGIETYLDQGALLQQAYVASSNESYRNNFTEHLELSSEFECLDTGDCDKPRIQGKAISFMTEAAYTSELEIGIERSIELTESEITVGDTVDAVCTAENTLEDSVIPSLNLTVTSGPELGSQEINYTIGDLEYNETNTTTDTFTSESVGTSEVICEYTSTEFVRTASETIDITSEQEDDDSDEDDDSSSEDEESSSESTGSGLEPSFEPEIIQYSFSYEEYDYTDFNLNDSYEYFNFYSDSCIAAKRTLYENRTVLDINQTCSEEANLIIQDTFNQTETRTEKIFNSSHESEIVYTFNSETEQWNPPVIAVFNQTDLELKTDTEPYHHTDHEFHTVNFELNRPQRCTIEHNGNIVSENNSIKHQHNISLEDGENEIFLNCDDISESYSVNYDKEDEDSILPVILKSVFGGLLIFSLMGAAYWRNRIVSSVRIKIFDFYFERVMKAIQSGNTDAAVNNYKKMSKFCNFPDQDSKFAVQEGLKLYMMVDLVSDAGTDMSDAELVGDVKTSLGQYLSENPDTALSRHIKRKIEDM